MKNTFLSVILSLVLIASLSPVAYADDTIAVPDAIADDSEEESPYTFSTDAFSYAEALEASWIDQLKAYDTLESLGVREMPVIDDAVEEAIEEGDVDPTALILLFKIGADPSEIVSSLSSLRYSSANQNDLNKIDWDFTQHRKTFTVRVSNQLNLQAAIDELKAVPAVECIDLNTVYALADDYSEYDSLDTQITHLDNDSLVQSIDGNSGLEANAIPSKDGTSPEGMVFTIDSKANRPNSEIDGYSVEGMMIDSGTSSTEAVKINDPGNGSGLWHLSSTDAYNAWEIKKSIRKHIDCRN